MADPSQKNAFSGGTQQFTDSAVDVSTGVTYGVTSTPVATNTQACADPSKTDTTYTDGITIKNKCNKNPHVLQFVYREKFGEDGKPLTGSITTTGGTYNLTTDPSKPNWNTDSASSPNPYYEGAGAHRSDADSLTTFDQPNVTPAAKQTSRATFKAFVICDGKVVREVDWVREQKSGSAPTYTVNVSKADKLPDWANDQLKNQGYNSAP